MEQNKKLSELSVEELLAGLEEDSTTIHYKDDKSTDFLTFLNEFNVVPGEQEIHVGMLYKLYKAWSKSPILSREFGHKIARLLPKNKNNVLIDEKQFKLKRTNWDYFASNPNKREISHHTNKKRFEAFLKYFELSKGEELVNFTSIELLYDRYIHETKRQQFNKKILKDFMKLYFNETTTVRGSYFRVSNSIWKHLNKEVYNAKEKEDKKKRKKILGANSRTKP